MKQFARREFLRLGLKSVLFIPVTNFISCSSSNASLKSPEDSLRKLILILGPWPIEDRSMAEDFSNRFLKADLIVVQFLPESASVIQQLAVKFPDDIFSLDEIDLDKYSGEERDVLNKLVNHIYNVNEIQFYLGGLPQWGQCIGDSSWHTTLPSRS